VTTETGTTANCSPRPSALYELLTRFGVEGDREASENQCPMRFPLAALAAALVLTAAAPAPPARAASRCAVQRATPAYAGGVLRVLRAKRDVWGEALIRRRGGPTYAAVRRLLKPLFFARGRGKPLTATGAYYLPFAQPLGTHGAYEIALHVADGSQILARTATGASMRIMVGPGGREPFGSCIARLTRPRLAEGYLPILETRYVDSAGVRYRQESFAVRGLGTGALVSFVSVTASAGQAGAIVRLVHSAKRGRGAAKSHQEDSILHYQVAPGETTTVYAAWLPSELHPVTIDAATYEAARRNLVEFWDARLGEGVTFDVPESVVMNAQRSLLMQELALTWRYSIGNPYEEFSFAEGMDVAEVMGSYGFAGVAKDILRTSFRRLAAAPSNWRMGELLGATARYYQLTGDRTYLDWATPRLQRFVSRLGLQIYRSPAHGLLRQERFSTDIAAHVYGLHAQTAVWQGLTAMAPIWKATGRPALAAYARKVAARLDRGLWWAVHASAHRLKDGSLFVPAVLLERGRPFDALTRSRLGSYWNLVMPYALTSGFFAPRGQYASQILRYMLMHGSRLLGLVRAGAYSLYGWKARYPFTGTDQVYGLSVARFLADNDRPDQLVLSLYGMLGAGMTPDTFVSGEAATVAPLKGAAYRSMYLPPNAASNSALLETLRLMLVHETTTRTGRPSGLELAYATPRGWLAEGKSIAVREASTSFGPLSYEIDAGANRIDATVDVPARRPPTALRLRLRVPTGHTVVAARVNGRPRPFDRKTATIDLSGLRGTLSVVAVVHEP
jgi:hypothetical protein